MKTSIRLSAFILLLIFASCRGKEFSIEFEMNPDLEESYRLLYYASDKHGGRWMETSAPIHQGKFHIECPTINPTIVYLFRSNGTVPETFFYAERGDKIVISGDNGNPLDWTIKGNDLSEQFNKWQLANLNNLRGHNPEEINKAVASYIEKNPGSEIDPLLLILRFDREKAPEEFVRLWNLMDKSLRKSPVTDLIASPDLFSPSPLVFNEKGEASLLPEKERFPILTMRSAGKGKDTLRIVAPGRKGSLVFFWHLGDPDRQAVLDTLGNLTKRPGVDSVRYLIADICLDGDSLRWKNTLPFDSLKKVRRGWWPTGPAAPEAIRLGINDYRTLVVFGPKGEVKYKGKEVAEAVKSLLSSK